MRDLTPLNKTLIGIIAVLLGVLAWEGRQDVTFGGFRDAFVLKRDRWTGSIVVCPMGDPSCQKSVGQ